MGVGAMTDFAPLIADPKSLLLGAAAQFGVFAAFTGALALGFSPEAASAIGIIGGADGPTAIPRYKDSCAYPSRSYRHRGIFLHGAYPRHSAPLMKALTTKRERTIHMERPRTVKKIEIVLFPIVVTLVVSLIVPSATPLVGFLMLGNLFNVSGVTERLSKTVQNELINITTVLLGVSVGGTANANNFLSMQTIKILVLGVAAFALSTVGGLLLGKLMCFLTHGKVNPLYRLCGRFRRPYGGACRSDGRTEGGPPPTSCS